MLHGGNKTFPHEENSPDYSICCVVIANGKKPTSESCTVTMESVTSPTESYEPLCASCTWCSILDQNYLPTTTT
jgi:hypothetical protein